MHLLRALPALQDNYIWLLSNDQGDAVVVDPGDAKPVLAAMEQGLRPVAILLTHHHYDHIDGAKEIAKASSAPIYAPVDQRIPQADFRVSGGDALRIDALKLDIRVMSVPGHTHTHIAYDDGTRLFCGDTLFSLGCGRLLEGTAAQMLASLDTFARLPAATLVCCAHEYTAANGQFALRVDPTNEALRARVSAVEEARQQGLPSLPSTIGSEIACNPFLRIDTSEVRRAIYAHTGIDEDDRNVRFAALRAWKDGFVAHD